MDRDEALKLLKVGRIEEWNQGRPGGEEIPPLEEANLSEAHLSEANLSGTNLSGANLSGANLSGTNLSGANLRRADLTGANLSGLYFAANYVNWADLSGADLSLADLSGADLNGADLTGAGLSGTNLSGTNLSEANLSGADLTGANLSRANLSRANLSRANLRKANLSGLNLSGLDLSGLDLSGAKLSGAKLSGAKLSGAKLSEANLGEANLSGANLRVADLRAADLSGANLSVANLSGADLSGAKLSVADLRVADLRVANLRGVDLSSVNLSNANLSGAVLSEANLRGANLRGADLSEANLRGADLRGADLSRANFTEVNLEDADVSNTNLTLARIIRCWLSNAIFEGADVYDCHVQETKGRPLAPRLLKVGDRYNLTGADATDFFNPPATVEVYLSSVFTNEEIGLYHFHLGEMQHRSVGTDVRLVGRRDEPDGTVLRFQAPTYEQIYQVLPVLLATFRRSRAIDWIKTYQNLPGPERGQVLTHVVRIETAEPPMLWVFANRLSEGLGNFPYADVKKIRDGRDLAVRIDIATNLDAARKLATEYYPRQEIDYHLTISGGIDQLTLEGPSMSSQEIKAGGHVVATSGEGHTVTAGDLVFQQVWSEVGGSIDVPKLADDLVKLRKAMQQDATDTEHLEATVNVSKAAEAAKLGNGPKALEYLKAAGKWALDTATKIGTSVASNALTKAIGVDKP